MSVKSNLMREINRRARKAEQTRIETGENANIYDIAFKFFDDVGRLVNSSHSAHDFHKDLTALANMLDSRFKIIDPKVKIEIEWENNDDDDWKDLRISGLSIEWSQTHLEQNPDKSETMRIDVSDVLFMD